MAVAVRPRPDEDLEECVELLERVHCADGYPIFWPDDPAKWLSPRGLLGAWVAAEHERVIGHIGLRAGEAEARAEVWSRATGLTPVRLATIGRFFVAPARRGLGVGAMLLEAACAAAVKSARHPALDVVETSTTAIRFYEQRGWRRIDSEPWAHAPDGKTAIHYYVAPGVPPTGAPRRSRGNRPRR